jgi:hypothetical protein
MEANKAKPRYNVTMVITIYQYALRVSNDIALAAVMAACIFTRKSEVATNYSWYYDYSSTVVRSTRTTTIEIFRSSTRIHHHSASSTKNLLDDLFLEGGGWRHCRTQKNKLKTSGQHDHSFMQPRAGPI